MRISSSGIRLVVKILVSAGLLAFLLNKISIDEFVASISTLDVGLIVAAMSVFLTSNIIGSYQWHCLLQSSGVDIPFHRTVRFYFVGLFFNNFLPANIGGDAVKVYDVSRIGSSVYQVIAVTMLDRIVGIFSLCLLASVAVVALMTRHPDGTLWPYLLVFIGCMMPALAFYFLKPLSRVLRWIVGLLRPLSIDKRGTSILDYLGKFKSKKRLILRLMLLSLVIQSMRVATHILVALALGVHVDLVVAGLFFVFVPLLSLAMIPPITINGLGIREGLGIILFARAGIGATDAFAVEFLTYLVAVSISLVGLVFFLWRRSDRATGRPRSAGNGRGSRRPVQYPC